MDGMLIEWEKMLADSEGLDDLEQSDIIDSELSLLGGKNESPNSVEAASMDGETNLELDTHARKSTKSSPSLAEDSAETLKLIAELNSDKSDEFDLPKFSQGHNGPGKTEAQESEEKSSLTGDESNTSSAFNSEVNKKETKNATYDNTLADGFENSQESHLQISEVRTGDIPKEIYYHEKNSSAENSESEEAESDEDISKESKNEVTDKPADDIVQLKISNVRTEIETNSLRDRESEISEDDSMPVLEKLGGNETDDQINNDEEQYENSMYLQQTEPSVQENTGDIVMMRIKEEPVEYEDYGKPAEFVTNFHEEFHGHTPNRTEPKTTMTTNMTKWTTRPEEDYTINDAGQYQCVYCSVRFATFNEFEVHYNSRHKSMYQCRFCGESFYRSQEIAFHYRYHHPDHTREKLQKKVYKKKSLRVSQDFDRDDNEEDQDSGKTILKRKKAKVALDEDGNPIYKCAYCSRKFRVQQAMASHVRNHHIQRSPRGERKDSKVLKKNKIIVMKKKKFVHGKIVEKIISRESCGDPSTQSEGKSETDEGVSQENQENVEKPLHYKNMSFESDTSQMEETIAMNDCSLKRELKSSLVYHCSKCPKWFYREKQVANHEKTCTGIKQEPVQVEPEQDAELYDGTDTHQFEKLDGTSIKTAYTNEEDLKIERKYKKDVEKTIQSEISKKLRQKMLQKKARPQVIVNKTKSRFKPSEVNYLPKYFCKYCPTSFEDRKDMNLHLLKHLGDVYKGDDKFHCRVCFKLFDKRSAMLAHLQEHSKLDVHTLFEQPHIPECTVCGMPFLNMLLLKHHVSSHVSNREKAKEKSNICFMNKNASNTEEKEVLHNTDSNTSLLNCVISASETGSTKKNTFQGSKPVEKEQQVKFTQVDYIRKINSSKNLTLEDIPYQCGMCFARFPNSQFLLHHITLHMQGPYVFKIESDEKSSKGDKQSQIKSINSADATNLETGSLGTVPLTKKSAPVISTCNLGQLKTVDPQTTSSTKSPKLISVPVVVKNPESVKVFLEDKGSIKPLDIAKNCKVINSISMDHKYTNSNSQTLPTSTAGNMASQVLLLPNSNTPMATTLSTYCSTFVPKVSTSLKGSTPQILVLEPGKMPQPISRNALSQSSPTVLGQGQYYQSLITQTKTQLKLNSERLQDGLNKTTSKLQPLGQYLKQHEGQSLLNVTSSGKSLLGLSSGSESSNSHSSVIKEMLEKKIEPTTTGKQDYKEVECDKKIKSCENASEVSEDEWVHSEEESLADYDSDDCEEFEKNANEIKTVKKNPATKPTESISVIKGKEKKQSNTPKRNRKTFLTNPKNYVPNFKKCLDIASGNWFECSYCLYLCQSKEELEIHMKNHDSPSAMKKAMTCPICGQMLLTKWHLNRHLIVHANESYKCSFCEALFSTSEDVVQHIANAHKLGIL